MADIMTSPGSDSATAASSTAGARGPWAVPALWAALLGFFVVTLDALVVNVALPVIGRQLGGGIAGLQWVIDGYTLVFAALLLSSGALSDRIGARRAFGAGLVVFVAASAAGGLAPALGVLIAARLVQGAGAAVVLPASLALLREAFPDQAERARAVSIWAVGGAVGGAAGPVLGGVLTQLSWRMIFFINLPVGVVALVLLARAARSPRRPAPFDWAGQLAAVLGLGGITYGLIEGGANGFSAPAVLAALMVGVAALAVFIAVESRAAHPVLPLGLFRTRAVAVPVAVGFSLNVGFYGMVFLLSLYLQQQRGLSALATGLAFVPMTALTAVGNLAGSRASRPIPLRAKAVTGQLLMIAGLLILCLAASVPDWLLVVLMIPVGVGGGSLAVPAVTALLLDNVPADLAGTASGTLNASRQFGGAVAVALFGVLVADHGSFLRGLRVSLLIAALTVLATTGLSLAQTGKFRRART